MMIGNRAWTVRAVSLAAMLAFATPVAAARVEVSANAGHYLLFPNGDVSNQTVYTSQSSIYNLLPVVGGYAGDLVRRQNGVVTSAGPGSSAPRWQIAASEPQSVARAYGDLTSGKVGAYAGTGQYGYAAASAIISDTLTFDIPGATDATITPLRFLLTLHAATADANAVFNFKAGFGNFTVLGNLNRPYYSTSDRWAASSMWFGGTTRYIDLVYNVQGANPVIGVETTLEALAGLGEISDLYHTAGLQLQLPSGVTFTSGSGVFLTAAVPEPATWAMLIVGFGLIGTVVRRQRARPLTV